MASSSATTGALGRDTRVDVLKGYAILMVVIGHAVQRAIAFGLITVPPISAWLPYSGYTTMPLFLMASGYLTFGRIRQPVGSWLSSKAKMLLLPWAAWTVVYYFVVRDPFIVTAIPFPQYVKTQLLAPSLWYLVVLFGCYLLVVAGTRLGDWTLPLLGLMLLPATFAWLPILSWYWWWFIAGYFVAKYSKTAGHIGWPVIVVMAAAYVVGMVVGVTEVTLATRVFFGVGGAALALIVAGLVRKGRVARLLAYLGVHSLPIYTGQFLFVQLVFVHSVANVLLTSVGAIAGSLAIEWVLAHNRGTNALFLGGRG